MTTRYTMYTSPVGDLLLTTRGRGLSGVFFEDHRRGPRIEGDWERDDSAFDEARAYLDAYFAGETAPMPQLDLETGTPFQRQVWQALRAIAPGTTRTYGELAQTLGRAGSARAVGSANARNPISIVVPCHRVIGADGALTGYAGGEARKRWLLDHERRVQ